MHLIRHSPPHSHYQQNHEHTLIIIIIIIITITVTITTLKIFIIVMVVSMMNSIAIVCYDTAAAMLHVHCVSPLVVTISIRTIRQTWNRNMIGALLGSQRNTPSWPRNRTFASTDQAISFKQSDLITNHNNFCTPHDSWLWLVQPCIHLVEELLFSAPTS